MTHARRWRKHRNIERSAAARDLQAFHVFSQHPKWIYYARKPIENAVYCFYETTFKNAYQKQKKIAVIS